MRTTSDSGESGETGTGTGTGGGGGGGGGSERRFQASLVELNVGGVSFTTNLSTLTNYPHSLLGDIFSKGEEENRLPRDSRGRFFIDRDPDLFRLVLDYMRNMHLVLPREFKEKERLALEATHFRLPGLITAIAGDEKSLVHRHSTMNGIEPGKEGEAREEDKGPQKGYLTIGYRGSFAFGRDGMADVKFRKMQRILVAGKVSLCREAFDMLNAAGFKMVGCLRFITAGPNSSIGALNLGNLGMGGPGASQGGTVNMNRAPSSGSEESKWNHYNEFIFLR